MNAEAEEKEILEFREKAISYFKPILLKEGYSPEMTSDLAFYIAKILEDAFPLIRSVDANQNEDEQIIDKIHMLFSNLHAFEEGKKILMWQN
jgi:hypothetical protein